MKKFMKEFIINQILFWTIYALPFIPIFYSHNFILYKATTITVYQNCFENYIIVLMLILFSSYAYIVTKIVIWLMK